MKNFSDLRVSLYNQGKAKIAKSFEKAAKEGRRALICYYPFGFPDIDISIEIINALSRVADLVEIGIPFSDPTADGPIIQEAYELALKNKATLNSFLSNLNKIDLGSPAVLMSYLNPIYQVGLKKISDAVFEKNINGFIVPDLPAEEKKKLFSSRKSRLPIVLLASPTDSDERILFIAKETEGFLYLVSSLGVTGLRDKFEDKIFKMADKLKKEVKTYIAVGFGVSNPEHINRLKKHFEGIIVGSALINVVRQAGNLTQAKNKLIKFVSTLKEQTAL